MRIKSTLLRLRFLGLAQAANAILYSFRRDWLELRYRSQKRSRRPRTPGDLLGVDVQGTTAKFRFSQAALEISFLAADLVRISWSPGLEPIPYAVIDQEWPEFRCDTIEAEQGWRFQTQEMILWVSRAGKITLADAKGQVLREDEIPTREGDEWHHTTSLAEEAHVYGLGERAASLNLRPGIYQLWNHSPGGSYRPGKDPLYLTIPLYLVIGSQGSYLIFYENSHPGTVSFSGIAEARFLGGALRYYLIPGPPARALERYSQLTGRAPLPPRWSLKYHQSRWGYKDEAVVRAIVDGFRDYDLPLGAIHLDLDYMDGFRVFTINQVRFPDLRGLSRELKQNGIRLVAILDCGVKRDPGYRIYREGIEADAFLKTPQGRPVSGPVWPGWSVFPDFSDPEVREWWGKYYNVLIAAGIDGFWHDMNEPTTFAAWGALTLPSTTRHAMEGRGGDHQEGHNLYGLLMAKAAYEALREQQPDNRPWILTRSGWAGVQRYSWNWTGDTQSTWAMLRQTIPTVLGLGLSGIPFSGPDIGGFSGAPSAELFTRWFQLAAFLPFFRNHAELHTPFQEPWRFGQPYLDILREVLRMRCRLIPYLYTLAWKNHTVGHPLVRPLWWPDGADPDLWAIDDAFFLGEALLVAPILNPRAESRLVRLPAGHWYHVWDDKLVSGPADVEIETTLGRIPVLARAGSVIPMEEADQLILHIYAPLEGEGYGELFSDAGDGYGPWRLDRFQLNRQDDKLSIHWKQMGEYLFPYKRIRLHLHGILARTAVVDGEEITIEGSQLAVGYFEEARIEGIMNS